MPLPPITSQVPLGERSRFGGMFNGLRVAGTGMTAQQFVMDVHAQNMANLETTKGATGKGPYQRQVAVLQGIQQNQMAMAIGGGGLGHDMDNVNEVAGGVRVASVDIDKSEGAFIYQPGHPDADANGYVHLPNVDVTEELLGIANARDNFNANATVFKAISSMLGKGLKI